MNRTLEHILPRVQKPARYTGGEYNAVVKDRRAVDVRYALCFPDTYEIGMSNLGVRILYGLMNEMDGVWCERVFAPWGDMEEEMRREGIPLYGLESGDSIADFDLIGFSKVMRWPIPMRQHADLVWPSLRSGERTELSPIVVAGGTCAFNPEPLAPFVDLFVLGEGEDVSVEIIQLYRQAREEGWGKGGVPHRRGPDSWRLCALSLRGELSRRRHGGRRHPAGGGSGQGDQAHRPGL